MCRIQWMSMTGIAEKLENTKRYEDVERVKTSRLTFRVLTPACCANS